MEALTTLFIEDSLFIACYGIKTILSMWFFTSMGRMEKNYVFNIAVVFEDYINSLKGIETMELHLRYSKTASTGDFLSKYDWNCKARNIFSNNKNKTSLVSLLIVNFKIINLCVNQTKGNAGIFIVQVGIQKYSTQIKKFPYLGGYS